VTNSGTTSAAVLNFTIPRGDTGAAGAAGPNSVTSATTSDGTAELSIAELTVSSSLDYEIIITGDGNVYANNILSGSGLQINSDAIVFSATGSGLELSSTGIVFTDSDGDRLNVSCSAMTDERAIVFPDASGTIALTSDIPPSEVKSANFTAADKGAYVSVATLTVADPSPSEGANFSVLVRNGTATVGGTAYSTAGTLIRRVFHSGAWANYPYSSALFGTNVATFLATPTSANLAAAVTDETGTGSLVFATSPTLTTPTIAQINGGTAANDDLTLQGTTNATRTTSYVILQPTAGNVGIGTTTPSHALQVHGTAGRLAVFGDIGASTSTATPVNVSFGSTFGSSAPGTVANLKWDLFTSSSSGSRYGIGMSAGLMELQAGPSGGFAFYVNQGTEAVRIDSTGGVGLGATTPNAKALLDLTSTTRGFLPPRMTTAQRDAITSVPAGLMIYNTTTNKLNFYNGSAWEAVTSA
jgi:hypothetical protein